MIYLIELFGGIGAQAKALENIGVPFTHHLLCEIDQNAVVSYNAIHGTSFIPSDIRSLKGADLNIRQNNTYILTYTFPCQSMSRGGKGEGMKKGSNTRSSLLWEVERLLLETPVLPQVLLMENVPQVHNKKNKSDFNDWLSFLESLGYKNFYQDLNAKDYGVPQNRMRTYMISLLEGNYVFPKPIKQTKCVGDILKRNKENLISKEKLKRFFDGEFNDIYSKNIEIAKQYALGKEMYQFNDFFVPADESVPRTIKSFSQKENFPVCVNPKGGRMVGDEFEFYLQPSITDRVYFETGIACACTTSPFFTPSYMLFDKEIIISQNVIKKYIIKKPTSKDCYLLMGFTQKDYNNAKLALSQMLPQKKCEQELFKQAGNSIVVPVLEHIFKELIKQCNIK